MTLSDNFRLAAVSRGPEWSRRDVQKVLLALGRGAAVILCGCRAGSGDGDDNTRASPTDGVVRRIFTLSRI